MSINEMLNRPTIAIVDDYPRWRSFLESYLTEQGFDVLCKAKNGKEFLSFLQLADSVPALCILDINMPIMNGFQTANALRELYPSIKILAFSMEIGRGMVNRMLDSGAHAFLAKGVAPQDISQALYNLLESHSQTQIPNAASNRS
ncbi:MAG: response regulator transcription factor [Bacteroidetes bacterium]|nr:response regulator transcription factor [Bacteroidota bacterium]MBS1629340.1 response regulator transcription factor [Bacteroidota bacterium]